MTEITAVENNFTHNYKILKEISEKLRNQTEPNIDELIPQIEKAMKAYQICQERLEHVSKAISKMLPEEKSTASLQTSPQ